MHVRLWEFETEADEKKRGVRLLRSLTGSARAAADSLEFDQLTSSRCVQSTLGRPKDHFTPRLEVSRAIYGASRSHKQDIPHYLIRRERS